jgi:hypothetical protein
MTVRRGFAPPVQLPPEWPRARPAIERELARTLRQIIESEFPALLLRAPDGSTWRVTVDDAGALTTVQVPRT